MFLSFVGTVGRVSNVVDSDYEAGIKNTALYLHDGGKMALTGSETTCWKKLQLCTDGMTMSIWFKPVAFNTEQDVVGSAGSRYDGFTIYIHGPDKQVTRTSIGRYMAVQTTEVGVDDTY